MKITEELKRIGRRIEQRNAYYLDRILHDAYRCDLFGIQASTPAASESRYEFRALATGEVEILIFGRIWDKSYDDTMVGADRIARDLAANPNATAITVKINSQGGDMFAGTAIYNTLKAHSAPVTIYVMGVAASAASLIAMAGDTVVMYPGSVLMIHKPWLGVEGDDEALINAGETVKKLTALFATGYQAKTGLDEATIMEIMKAETWLTPAEAVAQGFADKVDDHNSVAVNAQGTTVTFNGLALDTQGFKRVPQALLASASHKEPTPTRPGQPTEDTMDIKKLFADLRRRFGADKHPKLNQDLDIAEAQVAADATAEDVAARLTTAFETALNAAQALTAPLVAAGISTAEGVAEILSLSAAGKQYRTDLVAETMAAGVRAKGDKFDKDRYQRVIDASTIDDIKALRAEFDEEAAARLGKGGRQAQTQDPNAKPSGAGDTDIEADATPEAIKAFRDRTAPAGTAKPAA